MCFDESKHDEIESRDNDGSESIDDRETRVAIERRVASPKKRNGKRFIDRGDEQDAAHSAREELFHS